MMNLYLQMIGALALGGIAIGILKEHRETPLRLWEFAVIAGLALVIIYGITNAPNLGG
jgi:predicted membrane channel-forming protein YqfA (hemolysin III family)